MTGILKESGNGNVDKIVVINTNTGNLFFNRLGQYNTVIVLAGSADYVNTVVQEMDRLYGDYSFGIVSPAAIVEAQQHTQSGSSSLALDVGYIALLS